jgi:gamma-glutamyltranspeptidase / glutathione hydrolase
MKLRHDSLYPSRRSPVLARNIVATSQPLAAQAGLRMLMAGGNAIDAALAAAMTLVVVEPSGNGLGSDAFAIIWDGNELHGLNASGRSPAGWTPERFAGGMPERGWDSVTVPGAVSAWADVSARFGKLPFDELLAPAIGYARDGFLVSPVIGELWRRAQITLGDQPGFAEAFLPGGRAPRAGEVFAAPALADSLQLIAETRGEAFYRGALAERIAAFAREHGAAMTEADLAEHRNDWCGTISTDYDGVSLHEIPPNGQGIAACMALGILGHLGLERYEADSVEALHLQIEAMKLAFRDVDAYVADEAAMEKVRTADLLDEAYLASRARLVDPARATDFASGAPRNGGTVYVTAADADGMMVSYIQSNYMGFGSGIVVPGTGISMQNRGFGFVNEPGHPNCVGPRKRPRQTIVPAFLMRGAAPLMSFGVMGGPMQPQGHLQMTLRTQLWGQDPQTAADAPRWRVVSGLRVAVEESLDEALANALTALGHVIIRESPDDAFGFGGAQMIQRVDGGYIAASDPRKDGQAVGY